MFHVTDILCYELLVWQTRCDYGRRATVVLTCGVYVQGVCQAKLALCVHAGDI